MIQNPSYDIWRRINGRLLIIIIFAQTGIISAQNVNSPLADSSNKYQQMGDSLLEIGQFDQSILSLAKAGEFAEKIFQWEDVGFSKVGIAVNYWYLQEYQKLDSILKLTEILAENYLNPDHEIYSYLYNLSSQRYYFQGDFEKALAIGLKDIAWEKRQKEIDSANLATSYNNIGITYMKVRDFEKAEAFLEQSYLIRNQIQAELIEIAQVVNNLYLCYAYSFKRLKAKELGFKYLDLLKKSPHASSRYFAQAYMNLGEIYQNENQIDSTFYFLKLAQKHSKKANQYLSENIHDHLASAFKEINQLDSAEYYFHRAVKRYTELYGKTYPELAGLYIHLGSIYHQKGDYDRALESFHQVFTQFVTNYSESNLNGNPEINHIRSPYFVLSALIKKTNLLIDQYERGDQRSELPKTIFDSWALAIKIIDKMRQSYTTEGAKQFVLKERLNVFENAIRWGINLFELTGESQYLEKSLQFAESSKAYILRENLLSSEAKTIAGVPVELQQLEKSLKREIAFYNQKWWEADQKNDSLKRRLYQTYSFNKKQSLDSLKNHIQKSFPEYFQIMYQDEQISVNKIQEKLSDETQLLEYFTGEKFWFLFSISKNDFNIFSIEKTPQTDSLILALHHNLTDYQSIIEHQTETTKAFITASSSLFDIFLAPSLARKESFPKDLIIIPDGLMGIIPFEVLLTQPPSSSNNNFLNLDYLIKKSRIGYHFSADLWLNSYKSHSKKSKYDCLAMAPMSISEAEREQIGNSSQSIRSEVAKLPFSGDEVNQIRSFFTGKYYLDSAATKSEFLEQAENSRIIHLATHSIPDHTYPMNARLAFYQSDSSKLNASSLFAYELSNLNLNADLVVLSACETGVGKFFAGEGIASLGRGFMAAGAKNIVMSLWKIEDQASTVLMREFYKLLSEGYSVDEALQQSKINYLQQADPFQAHPFFWAGFISLGDSQSIHSVNFFGWGLGIGILFLALGALWFFRRKYVK